MIQNMGLLEECKKMYNVEDLNSLSLYRLRTYFQNALRQKMYVFEDYKV